MGAAIGEGPSQGLSDERGKQNARRLYRSMNLKLAAGVAFLKSNRAPDRADQASPPYRLAIALIGGGPRKSEALICL